ncbi:MAG: 4Fe-4S binding protein [bacterium]|nr:4Fe-4S binding protein [bacterium]
MEVDLSQFDDITDRVARAKAKSEAVRKAKQGGGTAPSQASASAPSAAPDTSKPAAPAETATPGLPILEFRPNMHFKLKGRAARTVGIRYDLVSFVYDDDPDQLVTADRYRLSHAHAEGDLVFAPRSEVYRPERVSKKNRVDFHDYLWLETRSAMTAKKKRPRSIAIINPDYCTGCNACIEVCPTDCIEEVDVADAGLDGIGSFCEVRLQDCIGCKKCVEMCPWEAIDMVDTGHVEDAYGIPAGSL